MKQNRLWLIPYAFFLICCVLDLVGCVASGQLERCVKPALMPLLSLTSFTWLIGRTDIVNPSLVPLLLLGQLFGFAGDTMLMGNGFVCFAGGIGLFLIGHIFYICLFGKSSLAGLKPWHWIAGVLGSLVACAALALVIGVNGAMLVPMGIYAFVLMMLIFSTLMGVLRFGGLTWWLLLCGACLFTLSDVLIAVHNFGGSGFMTKSIVIMAAYLVAQSLIAVGGLRLITGK